MVVDVFTYNGEADILEIRLHVLSPHVDEFIIVEAPTTFSGNPKPLYYERQKERFKQFAGKIRYFVVDEVWSESERLLARNHPNTQGAEHWQREFLQKESIKKALNHLQDDDIVFIGDVDEIWNRLALSLDNMTPPAKLKFKVYTYFLNNRSSEQFWGTIKTTYGYLKDKCLNELRTTNNWQTQAEYGWHFTSMALDLPRKLTDSYTKESYATEAVLNNLATNIKENRDFLGRDFTYKTDETEWPPWLTEHREDYQHLLKT